MRGSFWRSSEAVSLFTGVDSFGDGLQQPERAGFLYAVHTPAAGPAVPGPG